MLTFARSEWNPSENSSVNLFFIEVYRFPNAHVVFYISSYEAPIGTVSGQRG